MSGRYTHLSRLCDRIECFAHGRETVVADEGMGFGGYRAWPIASLYPNTSGFAAMMWGRMGARSSPCQEGEVPLMIGTWKPRMAALAREFADELKIGGCANPHMVRLMRSWIGNDDVGIVVGAVTVVDEDGAAARATAAAEAQMYLEVISGLDPKLGSGPPALDRYVFAGTPEEVAAHVERLSDTGVKRVEFGTPQGLTTARGVGSSAIACCHWCAEAERHCLRAASSARARASRPLPPR